MYKESEYPLSLQFILYKYHTLSLQNVKAIVQNNEVWVKNFLLCLLTLMEFYFKWS